VTILDSNPDVPARLCENFTGTGSVPNIAYQQPSAFDRGGVLQAEVGGVAPSITLRIVASNDSVNWFRIPYSKYSDEPTPPPYDWKWCDRNVTLDAPGTHFALLYATYFRFVTVEVLTNANGDPLTVDAYC
jgi:hypothetical protein